MNKYFKIHKVSYSLIFNNVLNYFFYINSTSSYNAKIPSNNTISVGLAFSVCSSLIFMQNIK